MSAARQAVMRAVRVTKFGGPEVLQVLSDVSIPVPQGNQILIKTFAAGVNPLDTYLRSGLRTDAYGADLPYTPGADGAGVVAAVGDHVTRYKVGERVYNAFSLTGSYAEYQLTEEAVTMPLHDSLSYSQGAAIGVPYCTAYRALVHKCRARPGETLLVHGASGAVGIASCQIARAMGLTVLGTAGTQDGLDLVRSNGAHHAFNHREPGYTDQIMAATDGAGVDVVVEVLASANLQADLSLARRYGRIALIGSRGDVEVTPKVIMAKELEVYGVMSTLIAKESFREAGAFLFAGQERGWLSPVVGLTFPLDKVRDAHTEVITHTDGSKGKIVLSVQQE